MRSNAIPTFSLLQQRMMVFWNISFPPWEHATRTSTGLSSASAAGRLSSTSIGIPFLAMLPAAPVKARPPPQRTADQQIGLEIEKLVEGAVRASTGLRSAVPPTEPDRTHDIRLATVLKNIKQASAASRSRVAPTQNPSGDTGANPMPSLSEADSAPSIVEIYRPSVEIYRRRKSGGFERDCWSIVMLSSASAAPPIKGLTNYAVTPAQTFHNHSLRRTPAAESFDNPARYKEAVCMCLFNALAAGKAAVVAFRVFGA